MSSSTRTGGGSPQSPLLFPAGHAAVVTLVATALVVLSQVYAVIPLMQAVSKEFGGNAPIALSTAFSACYALGFIVWGALADQFGHRQVLVIGMALLVLSTAACAGAASLWSLGLVRAVQGFAAASFAPVALAYLSEAVAPGRREWAIGAISTSFLVAGIAGQVGAQAIANAWGWQHVFTVSGGLLAFALVAIAVWVRAAPQRAPAGVLLDRFTGIWTVAKSPVVLWLAGAHVTLLSSFIAMYTVLGPHLERFGLDRGDLLWVRLVGLPGMAVSLAAAPLSARWGTSRIASIGFLAAAGGLLLEALASAHLIALSAATLLFVAGVALVIPAMIGLFGQAGAPNRAGGMALNGLVLFAGASAGPLLAALPVPFAALLVALALLLLAAAGCVVMSANAARRCPPPPLTPQKSACASAQAAPSYP